MKFPQPRLFSPFFILTLAVAAVFAPGTVIAFTILASLERDGNGPGGPSDYACTFCANTATRVTTHFSGGFPPPSNPVALPANSEIAGKASADLATGWMSGEAHAASFGHFEQHQMRFVSRIEESITITLPPTLPIAERIITVIGSVSGGAAATNRATAGLIYSLQVHNVTAGATRTFPNGWVASGAVNPSVVRTPFPDGYGFRVTSVIPNSRVVQITSQLEGTAWAEARHTTSVGIADAGANNMASMRIILPAGATYTSTSGVFLTGSRTDAWRQQYFGTAENSGPGADDADPDGDGIVNQMEFATLTNPLIFTALPVSHVLAGENIEFTYTRNKAALGELTFAVEAGETLDAGSWSTAGISESILSDDGTVQQIKATIPAGGKRGFARLAVAIAPP